MVRLTRIVSFSAGHRYWLDDLSADQNRALYGPWASPFNHGHNYVLEVTAEGPVNPAHGMVVNIKDIDSVLKERIISQFDQRSINDEVPALRTTASTIENLLTYLASQLEDLPGGARLVHLKLIETPLLYGELDNSGPKPMMTLTRVYEFAASHRLHVPSMSQAENNRLFGKCNNPTGHGHNYVLEVTVGGEPDPRTGMLVDIGALDTAVNQFVVDRYDHHNLDTDLPEFEGKNTTSEVVAQTIFEALDGQLPARLERVRLFETARNAFEVRRP